MPKTKSNIFGKWVLIGFWLWVFFCFLPQTSIELERDNLANIMEFHFSPEYHCYL